MVASGGREREEHTMESDVLEVEEAREHGSDEQGSGEQHERGERGITTAEYAVGTAAGAGLAGLLYKLLTGGFGDNLLKTLFDHVLELLGIG